MPILCRGITLPAYNDTFDDFNLKWANTIALWKNQLVAVSSAHYLEDNKDSDYQVRITTFPNKLEVVTNLPFDSLKPILFDSQFFNVFNEKNLGCFFLSRLPHKQNKRSVSPDNTLITNPMNVLLRDYEGVDRWHISLEFVHALLARNFPSIDVALSMCTPFRCIAISPNFAVSLSTISASRGLLMNQFGFIGEIDAHNIYVKHKGSVQEVSDFISRNNLNVKLHAAN